MHYVFMGLVSVTAVASFDTVGAIMVVAMLLTPAAAAYLWTDSLAVMLVLGFWPSGFSPQPEATILRYGWTRRFLVRWPSAPALYS